jgi:acyl-coenzyme A synthetase/AMP-(fatty) acid ligase
MRADGSIEYHGRSDDVLTSGGFRISPIEVEEAIHTHPNVLEAAAVDFQITSDTRVIKLYFTADCAIPDAELHAHAKAHLARHKRPRIYERVDKLPRNPNGKLLRKNLNTANEKT